MAEEMASPIAVPVLPSPERPAITAMIVIRSGRGVAERTGGGAGTGTRIKAAAGGKATRTGGDVMGVTRKGIPRNATGNAEHERIAATGVEAAGGGWGVGTGEGVGMKGMVKEERAPGRL